MAYSKTREYMHRKEFVKEMSRRTGLSEEDAGDVTSAFLAILIDTWSARRSVCFDGFGLFDIRPTSERMARNPKSMEDALIPAGYKPMFKASKGLRASVNQRIAEQGGQPEDWPESEEIQD